MELTVFAPEALDLISFLILYCVLPSFGNPNCEQTASAIPSCLLLQMVPQRPAKQTSTLPSLLVDPSTSLISPLAQFAGENRLH